MQPKVKLFKKCKGKFKNGSRMNFNRSTTIVGRRRVVKQYARHKINLAKWRSEELENAKAKYVSTFKEATVTLDQWKVEKEKVDRCNDKASL